ncbi:hypothetical protein Dgeo_2952 (plasmid) [Deinococcus geothermalis DSM 11300]|uniref:Uncharacterized protein n=1 Tax=Deinococcus geothermalis (strain DSM 11300 / CIP 105573 / AG-3a) TaxID=319795 RepID=A8ZR86_DEIGD|nr:MULTISPECIES: hypothetical protein [Deinococcus]ABW34995.1 hypothetical protein Dgeo_2952 [Deinococcus geothermalis DSM 11300]TDE84985.1 hypothetical protein E0686_14175 [Deinococcus sp. S9]
MHLRTLLTLLALSAASAQSTLPPQVNARPTMPTVRADVSGQLPDMILTARQVVLYAPALLRPDVAEAVRRALTERGTQVYLITTRTPLFTDNSFTFRILLMNVPTYLTAGIGTPFALIDGRGISGPGVAGPGAAAYTTAAATARLADWVERVTRATQPLDPVQVVKSWVAQKHGLQLR